MVAFWNVTYRASAALAILAGLSLLAHAQTGPADPPPDVMELIARRSSCLEWSQKAAKIDRGAQLDDLMSTIRSLKCDDAAADEKALREKYAGDPSILAALDGTWVKVVKCLPVPIPPDQRR